MTRKRPNVLFILTDQQRRDCVGANGNRIIRTPALDSLAADGVNFTCASTAAIACVPSRACIMSGQYPHVNGVQSTCGDNWLRPETPTLPGVFAANGYRSVGVGKMHASPWDNLIGFDERVIIESKYGGEYDGRDDEYRAYLKKKGSFEKRIGHHTPSFGKEFKSMLTTELHPDDHIDAYIGRKGVEKLDELIGRNDPFFLTVSFCGPHDPYDPPPEFAALYPRDKMKIGPFRDGELDILPPDYLKSMITCMGREKLNLTKIPEAKKREIISHYYGNVTFIDTWIGKLLDLLKERGEYENTIVAFTSDHGDCLTDHNILYKGTFPCESDCGVPLIVKPDAKSGSRPAKSSALVDNASIMPTLLDLARVKVPYSCQGTSIKSLILGGEGTADVSECVVTYAEGCPAWRIRTRTHSFVYRFEDARCQLYDLGKDPHELYNLVQIDPEDSAPLAGKMREILLKWFARNGAPRYLI